jgi:hypothetical protein
MTGCSITASQASAGDAEVARSLLVAHRSLTFRKISLTDTWPPRQRNINGPVWLVSTPVVRPHVEQSSSALRQSAPCPVMRTALSKAEFCQRTPDPSMTTYANNTRGARINHHRVSLPRSESAPEFSAPRTYRVLKKL